MQTRLLLFAIIASVAVAGCAENNTPGQAGDPPGGNGGATPPATVSNAEAQTLFASAASNVPERYGMDMSAKNATTTLMTAKAVYDEPAETAYFKMTMDPAMFEDMGEGMSMTGGDAAAFQDIAVLVSPQGNAFLVNGTVMLSPPEDGQFDQAAQSEDGFAALTNPEDFIAEMNENNFTVHSVTPTTLRGKGALKLDATIVEEGHTQNMSVWIFQNPTRIARIESTMPADEEMEEDDPFGDATMTLDMLYDSEVTLSIPTDLQRALGLRYESDQSAFSFGGDEGPETWTFQVDGGIALGDIQAEVGEYEAEEPTWTMLLTAGTKTEDGMTITFNDVDSDGKVSEGDTLVIDRGEEGMGMSVSLRDNVTGLRVVPGFGALLVGLAAVAAIVLTRRR